MSEYTWYSRLLVWVGAVILLVESLTGRTLGVVTVVGVLALAGGLMSFIFGLAADAGYLRREPALQGETTTSSPAPAAPPPAASGPPEIVAVAEEPVTLTETRQAPSTAEGKDRVGAIGIEISSDGRAAGVICPVCHEPLRAGQVAAECWECQTVQHASCWVGNRFRCGRDGCGGHGPLEAPASLEESAGPSTA